MRLCVFHVLSTTPTDYLDAVVRHVTNVHSFIALNADETKLLKHRKAFIDSLAFLFELTKSGVNNATKWIRTPRLIRYRGVKEHVVEVRDMGEELAQALYKEKGSSVDKAAAALLVTALFGAYNTAIMVRVLRNVFRRERAYRSFVFYIVHRAARFLPSHWSRWLVHEGEGGSWRPGKPTTKV